MLADQLSLLGEPAPTAPAPRRHRCPTCHAADFAAEVFAATDGRALDEWRGEAPSRTAELSAEVASLRHAIAERA